MIRGPSVGRWSMIVIAVGLTASGGAGNARPGGASTPLRLRTSAAFAPCLAPALGAFSRETGTPVVVDVRAPDPPGDADLVVGDDSELTRALESGVIDRATSVDLGYIPWVIAAPADVPDPTWSAIGTEDRLLVLGGRAGRDARETLGRRLPTAQVRVSEDPEDLRGARYALVPLSLAGSRKTQRFRVRPLVATAAVVADAPHPVGARRLLVFLQTPRGRSLLSACLAASPDGAPQTSTDRSASPAQEHYGASVVDWWLPECSLDHNGYNDPREVLGPPDAESLGSKDQYRGFMSLGQGGYVTVDMGALVTDGTGADIRVFQTVSGEPVTLYASAGPQGPFVLLGLREYCGNRASGVYSHYCDFDLREGGLAEARYFKIEDGEIYPCLAGTTITEGADIDAILALSR